jgi:hypothetical protein
MQVVVQSPTTFRLPLSIRPRQDLRIFQDLCPPRHNYWPALLISGLLHAFLIWVVPFAAEFLPAGQDEINVLKLSARTLDIRVPEHLYIASSGTQQAKQPADRVSKPAAGGGMKSPHHQAASLKQAEPAPAPVAKQTPRMFQLPDLPIRAKGEQTLLQPQYAPQLAPPENVRLPEVMFWASQAPSLPRPVKPFVMPGRTNPVTAPPSLDAPPRLEMPNSEALTADMSVATASLNHPPVLPRPAATTMPVRTFVPPQPGPMARTATIDLSQGDPTNVLALAPEAPPLSEVLHVPAGNLRAPLLILPPGSESPQKSPKTMASAGSGFGARGVAAVEGAAAAALTSVVTFPGASASLAQLSAGMAVKIVNPINGVFDLVVQSSIADALPASAGILSGRPIYTAYIRAGGSREWVLQYCLPNATDAEISAHYLHLGVPTPPLKAPFPLVSFKPLSLPAHQGYVMVHGTIDEQGKFLDLKTAGKIDPKTGALLLAFLEKWEFRPATKGGRPVAVEVLLAIPPGA